MSESKITKDVEKSIDTLMSYLALSDLKRFSAWDYQNIGISYFEYPEPLDCPLSSELAKLGAFISEKDTPDALSEPLNCSWLIDMADHPPEFLRDKSRVRYRLKSCKQMSLKEVRGRVRLAAPYILEEAEASITEAGTYETARSIFGLLGDKLVDITNRGGAEPIRDTSFERGLLGCSVNLQLVRRYKWKVGIRTLNKASLGFISSPSAVRELFHDRDVPEGKRRRAAIRNWVSGHYRKGKEDPEDSIWVRKHLRGVETFMWNGLEIKVFPPKYEVEQLKKLSK